MNRGHSYTADVSIGNLALGIINVTAGLDGTITLVFDKGENSIGDLDTLFRSEPTVTIDGEALEGRKLQAYRVDASGIVEVSFLGDEAYIEPIVEEVADEEPTEEGEESNG